MKINLFNSFSQMIGPIGFKFSVFYWGHPGVVLMKFGED